MTGFPSIQPPCFWFRKCGHVITCCVSYYSRVSVCVLYIILCCRFYAWKTNKEKTTIFNPPFSLKRKKVVNKSMSNKRINIHTNIYNIYIQFIYIIIIYYIIYSTTCSISNLLSLKREKKGKTQTKHERSAIICFKLLQHFGIKRRDVSFYSSPSSNTQPI